MTEKPNTYYIKQGDLLPALEIIVLDLAGDPLSLEPYDEAYLYIAPCVGGRRIVAAELTYDREGQTGDAIGKVAYTWLDGDTDKPGEYLLEVELRIEGKKMTVPRSTYDKLIITPRL